MNKAEEIFSVPAVHGRVGMNKTAAVVCAGQFETLSAIAEAMQLKLAHFILYGRESAIRKTAEEHHLMIDAAEIVDCSTDEEACVRAAEDLSADRTQIIMKGIVHTSLFTHALLNKELNLVPEGGLLSHIALMKLRYYHKPFLLTDAALNIAPDTEKKVRIIRNAAAAARKLGISRPKIACIAPVENVKKKIPSTVDAHDLVQRQKNGRIFGDVIIDGPLSFDLAMSADAAEMKSSSSPVAGDPDILLLPCLDAANAVLKSLILFGQAQYGGIISGLKKPVVLTSRSDHHEARLLSLRLALAVSGGGSAQEDK